MSERLLESDFLTVDLGAVLRSQVAIEPTTDNAKQNTAHNNEMPQRPANYNWGQDLKDRLASNKSMSPESRKSEYSIETQFFTEFFTNLFKNNTALAKRAIQIGDLLQKDIKILGFTAAKNPIIAFLSIQHVQTALLGPGLLNANTYKAIHNAVANGLMADSEFKKSNDYNIIYCKDLYTKSAAEMIKYLTAQQSNLKAGNYPYTPETQKQNKKTFFYIDQIKEQNTENRKKAVANFSGKLPSAKSANTKLNNIELTSKIAGIEPPTASRGKSSGTRAKNVSALAAKLSTPAHYFAALQYLSVATEVKEAKAVMQHSKFNELSVKDIAAATAYIASIMPDSAISETDVKALAAAILNKLEQEA
jgi:hypothetical protein